jgi:hypothetical protein
MGQLIQLLVNGNEWDLKILRTTQNLRRVLQFANYVFLFTYIYIYIYRGTRWRSWLHCSTSRKVAGSIPDGVIGIFY